MAKSLKKDNTKRKGAYIRTKTKLMMTLKGGMSSKMHLVENLSLLSSAFVDVVCAVESLESHYKTGWRFINARRYEGGLQRD